MLSNDDDKPGSGAPRDRSILQTASTELGIALRNGRKPLLQVQNGLVKVLQLDPLTAVKDLVIVGEGPAAAEIHRYCEDQTVRGYRFRGIFSDVELSGELKSKRMGGVAEAHKFILRNRIDIVYCALPGTHRQEITELMEFCERHTIRFRVIPSAESFIPVVKTTSLEFHGAVPTGCIYRILTLSKLCSRHI